MGLMRIPSLQGAMRSFSRFSASRPEVVQSCAGAFTWMLGNAVTQNGRPGQEELDLREMVAYGAYGSVVSNVGHLWYRHLHVITNRTFRLGTYPMIGAKLCADCFIFNPIHVSALISWTHLATMKPAEELPGVLKQNFLPMVAAEAAIWTPVQFLNFRLLPVQHQQMFVNFMSIVEAAVLSWLAEKTGKPVH